MNKRSVDDNFARQACVYGASCYMKVHLPICQVFFKKGMDTFRLSFQKISISSSPTYSKTTKKYFQDPEHLYKFQHPGENPSLAMRVPEAPSWQPTGTEVALRGGPPGATQQNPAGLYGFDTTMATFPPGRYQ